MTDDAAQQPDYRTIRITHQDDPVSAVTDLDAWQAREDYPEVKLIPAAFGCAVEAGGEKWQILDAGGLWPQQARDVLASHFRKLASQTPDDPELLAQYQAAYTCLDWERRDEMDVAGLRYKIFRVEQTVRSGPVGPEPPRPSDPDPTPVGKGYTAKSRTTGLVLDPASTVGLVNGIRRLDLSTMIVAAGTVPRAVRQDAELAMETHPGVLLLPALFGLAEFEHGAWRPSGGHAAVPQAERDSLAGYLREFAPRLLPRRSERELELYAEAADRLDAERGNEVDAAGRRFRIIRIDRCVRFGPDGPEPPRGSDLDPELPIKAFDAKMRAEGKAIDEDDNEDFDDFDSDSGSDFDEE